LDKMLILLQPGIEPLGQFDLEDDDASLVKGGEVAVFRAINVVTDGYAADVFQSGPSVHLKLGTVATDGVIYGLVDEGTSQGLGGRGYGTMFGTIIGTVVGQGTGVGGTPTVGTVVVGPSTVRGSGKATLWTKPGLYGTTSDAWESTSEFNAATLNARLYGTTADGTNDGKLSTGADNADVALVLGPVTDASLVSTTQRYAGVTDNISSEYVAIYLLGVQS
jgi:hypothetical protein